MEKTRTETKCVMCDAVAEYIATETEEPLCNECTSVNEGIKARDYPNKVNKFPPKKI